MTGGPYTTGVQRASTHYEGGVMWDAIFDSRGNLFALVNDPDDVRPLSDMLNSHATLTADLARVTAERDRLATACRMVCEFRGATDPELWQKVRVVLTEACHTALNPTNT